MNNAFYNIERFGIHKGQIDKDIVDYWNTIYFTSTSSQDYFIEKYNQYLQPHTNIESSLSDFLNRCKRIVSVIQNKPFRIRDTHSVITLPKTESINTSGHASSWHTDYANSFALMILMNDISIHDSHMEFVVSKKYDPALRLYNFDASNMTIKKCIGKAGTYYLFNNGNYIHRAKLMAGKERKTIHSIYLPI